MRNHFFKRSIWTLLLMALIIPENGQAQNTLRLFPTNYHYLTYQNKPIVLITSAEHYGELSNLDFDYIKYLDALHKEGSCECKKKTSNYPDATTTLHNPWVGQNIDGGPTAANIASVQSRNGGRHIDIIEHWADWNNEPFSTLLPYLTAIYANGSIMELAF